MKKFSIHDFEKIISESNEFKSGIGVVGIGSDINEHDPHSLLKHFKKNPILLNMLIKENESKNFPGRTRKSLDDAIRSVKGNGFDNRNLRRLAAFVPAERLHEIGFEIEEGSEHKHNPLPFTRENILIKLKEDVAFGFSKVIEQRGLSAMMMCGVVQMWNFILQEGLEDYCNTEEYGFYLYKATAELYGFENPIGDYSDSNVEYSIEDY